MCGLFGHVGQRPAEPLTIKLLWIYSSLRGTDSTGMYRNGIISKRWYEWHKNSGNSFEVAFGSIFRKSTDQHTVIGHCRAKSVGLVSEKNTHPFEYIVNDNRWIFAHNGTIKNVEELATKYNIDRQSDETDSQTLGHILAEGNWDVLLEYKGSAAFSLYNETEDTLYLWRGFSCHDTSKATDERPLCIYQGRNYIYWASDIVNLGTALNTKKNMDDIDPNTLLVIKGGRVIDAIVYDRSKVDSYYVATTYYNRNNDYEPLAGRIKYSTTKKHKNIEKKMVVEPNPQNIAKNKVYYWRGKYYRNGHPLNGTYMIDSDGSVCNGETCNTDYELYYFFKGFMLKGFTEHQLLNKSDIYSLEDLLKESYKFSECWLHPEVILPVVRGSTEWFAMNGRYLSNCRVAPKFGYYIHDINGQGDVLEYQLKNLLTTVEANDNEDLTTPALEEQWAKYFN